MHKSSLMDGVLCHFKLYAFHTYKGKNVVEAEEVRISTPTQIDAMLQAAVLHLFASSNMRKSCMDIFTVREMHVFRISTY